MSTTNDLRSTLEQHAHDIDPLPTVDRLSQVQGRVRGVRRRRGAAVAGVAAALVAVAGATLVLPQQHKADPADKRKDLAGHTAPATMDSLGFGYSFTEAVEGDQRVSLKLPAAPTPRLVTWSATDDSIRLKGASDLDGDGSGPDSMTSKDTDFSQFEYLEAGEPLDAVARADTGQVALAVYDLASTPPAAEHEGIFFRRDVAGARLLASAFGDPGQTEITVDFVMPTELRLSEFCSGVPDTYWVWVEVGAGGPTGTTCKGAQFDPGRDGDTSDGWADADGRAIRPGDRTSARVWVTKGHGSARDGSPAATAPGVRLGIGLYDDAAPVATVGGWQLPAYKEADGHLYAYADSVTSTPGSSDLTWSVTAGDSPLLVFYLTSQRRDGTVRVFAEGGAVLERDDASVGGGSGNLSQVGALRDRTVTYRMSGGRAIGPRTVLGFVTYERVE